MDKDSIAFFEKLSNCFGPSGFEREALKIMRDYVEPYSDEVYVDKLGSLLYDREGTCDEPVVLLPGHIDEVGYIVSSINKQGFVTFNPLGGWFDQTLLGQRVTIRTSKGDVDGVISAKPPHLLTDDERAKVVRKDQMFIDIGASNDDEVKSMGIRIGNPAVPVSTFSAVEKKKFKDGKAIGKEIICFGKAFDDRVGAFAGAEVVRTLCQKKIKHPNKVIGASTVQEEVGIRGARTASYITKPDVCLTLEVDIAGDIPGIEAQQAPTKMGDGPSITTYDSSMIPNSQLVEFIIRVAEKSNIPYQLSQIARGGTDAGIIHLMYEGCPSVVLSVPTRHIHSHVGVFSANDLDNCIKLVIEVIKRLDKKTADGFTAY